MNTSDNILSPNEISIEVIYAEDTIWLSQVQFANVFQVTTDAISFNLQNTFREGDLQPDRVIRIFSVSKIEGGRTIQRQIKHYNLDVLHELNRKIRSRITVQSITKQSHDNRAILTIARKKTSLSPQNGVVYFIQSLEGGLIKIGKAQNLKKRFANIQSMSPVPLKILAVVAGYHEAEIKLHQRFAHLRSHGEWFHPNKELLDYIRQHGSPHEIIS